MKVGDKVKLRSDGPEMTVRSVEDNLVSCDWFNKNGENYDYINQSFPIQSLLSEKDLEEIKESGRKFTEERIRRGLL